MENTNNKLLNSIESISEFNKLCYEFLGYEYSQCFEYYKENDSQWVKSDKGIWYKPETLLSWDDVVKLQEKGKAVLDDIKIIYDNPKIDKIYPQKYNLVYNNVYGDFYYNWNWIIKIVNEILYCPRPYNTSVLANMKLTTSKEEVIEEIHYLLKRDKNEKS